MKVVEQPTATDIADLAAIVRGAVESGRGRLDSTYSDDPQWVAGDCAETWGELQKWLRARGVDLIDMEFR